MKKRGNLMLILFAFVVIFLNVFFVSAQLNLKISGNVNGYSSDVVLKNNSASLTTLDGYDFVAASSPSNLSQFYSNVSGSNYVIDSWATNPRTLNLVYTLPSSQSGTLNLSWPLLNSNYDGNITYYGSDGSYTTSVSSANLSASTSLTASISGLSTMYVRVIISNHVISGAGGGSGGGSGGAGGGGGGGGSAASVITNLAISTDLLEIPSVVGTVKTRTVEITNPGATAVKVDLKLNGLDGILLIEGTDLSFTLAPGEKRVLNIKIVSPESPGIYTGKILVNSQAILVSVNVNTKALLFDASVVVPDTFKILSVNQDLESQVTLIPMGDNPRLDVTLGYVIKDFNGKVFLTQSDTILVDKQMNFKKVFSTKNIPPGDYILGLELTYPNGVATSTSHFRIAKNEPFKPSNLFLIFLGIIILVSVILVVLIFRTYKRISKHRNVLRRKR